MRQRFRNKKERARRVEEAATRRARYDALTTEQKLDRALSRSVYAIASSATKEVCRLAARVENGAPIGATRLA